MQTPKVFKTAGLFAVLSLVALATARAQLATWTGLTGGEWNTAANWNIGVPGVGTNALINSSTTVNYNLPMAASGFGILTNNGILNLNTNGFNTTGVMMLNAGSSAANGRLIINTGAVVNVTGNLVFGSNAVAAMTVGSSVAVSGTLIVGCGASGGTGSGNPSSYATLTNWGGALSAAVTDLNPGNGSIGSPCRLIIAGGTNNLGAFAMQRGDGGNNAPQPFGAEGLVVSNGFVNTTSISIGNNAHGIMYLVGGTVTNSGTLTLKNTTGTRPARFVQTGGFFINTDPNVIVMNPSGAGDTAYSVLGGTNVVGGIQLGSGTAMALIILPTQPPSMWAARA